MAEIKSSIELALEKTKHLIMSAEEKKEQERRDLENKIRTLFRRLMEKYVDRDNLLKEFENLKEKEHKKLFIEIALDNLNLMEENEEIVSVLELIHEDIKDKVDRGFIALSRAFREELEKREMILKERLREKLKEMGIEGDAIMINLESWEEREKELEEVKAIFSQRLKKWKESVLSEIPL
jgi:hypothetical protein